MRFENTITIRRDSAEVFAYLADFENVPKWNYAIVETSNVSDTPVGVGTRYRQVRKLPRPSEERFEVTEFEPGARLSVEGICRSPVDSPTYWNRSPEGRGLRTWWSWNRREYSSWLAVSQLRGLSPPSVPT
jgi:uncharacterized protein YndB with AHSA1/START domain